MFWFGVKVICPFGRHWDNCYGWIWKRIFDCSYHSFVLRKEISFCSFHCLCFLWQNPLSLYFLYCLCWCFLIGFGEFNCFSKMMIELRNFFCWFRKPLVCQFFPSWRCKATLCSSDRSWGHLNVAKELPNSGIFYFLFRLISLRSTGFSMKRMSKIKKALESLHLSIWALYNSWSLIFFYLIDAKSKVTSPRQETYLPFVPIRIITI